MALALHFLVLPSLAADANGAEQGNAAAPKAHQLSEWQLGPVIFGPKRALGELKGKVVLIEHWGVRCPPCLAVMPHLAELDKNFRDKGLCVIGAEMWGGSQQDIKPLLDKAGAEYTVTSGASGPIPVNAVPACFVFDGQGGLVYGGYPAGPEFENAIKDALAKLPVPGGAGAGGALIPTRTWTNLDGREISAAVKRADATNVTFLMPNGKEVAYRLDKLSEESRGIIVQATQAKP
jgi:thiol-disulfide isomerase/thioredoxin